MNGSTLLVALGIALLVCLANTLLREAVMNVSLFALNIRSLIKLAQIPFFWLSLFLYGFCFLIWLRLLAIAPIGLIYPVLMTSAILIMALISILFLREPIGFRQLLGMGLALAGIILLTWPGSLS